MSSLSGLNAAPRTATRLPSSEPSQTSRASSTMRIRRRMLMLSTSSQEGQRLVGAELAGAGHERADVLGQAAAAEAEAGVEELAADPVVVADRVGQLLDVGAGGLAQLGHRVDEGDLGGEEGVGRRLHHLGGGVVGDDLRGAALDDRARRPRRAARGPSRRPRRRGCRRPAGRGAGCPGRRSPRAGTPGSRPACAPGHLARDQRRPAGPRCPPARWTCRRRGRPAPSTSSRDSVAPST